MLKTPDTSFLPTFVTGGLASHNSSPVGSALDKVTTLDKSPSSYHDVKKEVTNASGANRKEDSSSTDNKSSISNISVHYLNINRNNSKVNSDNVDKENAKIANLSKIITIVDL